MLGQGCGAGIIYYDGRYAEPFSQDLAQRDVVPAGQVGRTSQAAPRRIDDAGEQRRALAGFLASGFAPPVLGRAS